MMKWKYSKYEKYVVLCLVLHYLIHHARDSHYWGGGEMTCVIRRSSDCSHHQLPIDTRVCDTQIHQ